MRFDFAVRAAEVALSLVLNQLLLSIEFLVVVVVPEFEALAAIRSRVPVRLYVLFPAHLESQSGDR